MTIRRIKSMPKPAHVYRQFVFVGRAPHGAYRELVAATRCEIDIIAACDQLTGLLTYHNVKVWPRGRYDRGRFSEWNAPDIAALVCE